MTADRVAIVFRGPRGLRQEETFTYEGLPKVVDLLESGPKGWTIARIDFLDDSLSLPFFIWRLELPQLRKEWVSPRDHRWGRPHWKAGTIEEAPSW